MEEYGEDEDDQDVINEEQEKEENHMDPRQDEQFEIPDDLQLEQSDEENENPEPLENDPNDLPDTKMDSDDEEENEDDGEEQDGEEDPEKDGKQDEDEPESNETDDQLDPSKIDHINPEGDEPEQEEQEKENDDNTALTANEQQDENPPDSEQPLGVKDKTGSKSNISNTDEEMKEENEESNADDDNGMTLPTASDNDTGALKNLKSQPQQPQQQQQQQQKKPQQVDPNPYRSMGDAQKEWKKRLNLLQEKEEEEPVDNNEKAPKQDDTNQEENQDQNYEFKKDDQDNKDEESEQALAAATESQLQDMPKSAQDEDQDQDMQDVDDNDDQMDLDNDQQEQQVEHKEDQNESLDDKKKMSLSKLKQDAKKEKEEKEKLDKQRDKNDDAKDGLNTKDVNKEKLDNISSLDKENAITDNDQEQEEEEQEEEQGDVEEKKLTREDFDKMRQDLELFKIENNNDPEYSNELWKKYEQLTNDLSQDLCEQLRLILEPTLATKLQGDYKTGKRINMKKVIPYIASQFKKDKIWLRRTKPNKRQYQVLVAIDDTESMAIYHSGQFALEALTMISRAMSRLEVGQLGILRFGEDVSLVHSFDQVFSDQSGPDVITQFKFNQSKTNMVTFLSKTLQIMEMNKQQQSGDALQLVFIISDGWSLRDPETTRKHLREAATKNLFIVFIVIDNPVNNNSILDFESITFNNGKIQRTNYMSEFPFPYYVILRSLDNLPTILGDTLRQWFEMIKHIE
ncbi:hypothetical protein CYY_002269 [Polysphondylium violaceum]|uniref:VWFA domain-containing protein n=1 Tax=Polysphondylium violaceum TaxID=133409 RepID=A0A8J4V720_9MYCE|nr:hypothetical protein CYY_002269 [Polysphondylium violaceum]